MAEALQTLQSQDRLRTYVILLLVHDCLKILKLLAGQHSDPINFSADNLLVKNGHLVLTDAYISKTNLKRQIRGMPTQSSRWLVANLEFVLKVACTLIAGSEATEMDSLQDLISHPRVRHSPLNLLLLQIYQQAPTLAQSDQYAFICRIKTHCK